MDNYCIICKKWLSCVIEHHFGEKYSCSDHQFNISYIFDHSVSYSLVVENYTFKHLNMFHKPSNESGYFIKNKTSLIYFEQDFYFNSIKFKSLLDKNFIALQENRTILL